MSDFFSFPQEKKEKIVAKFKLFYKESDPKECWIWTGSVLNNGYGRIRWSDYCYLAHRFSWMVKYNSPIPEGLSVNHRCDQPLCVNSSHLSLGDHATNMSEASQRDRKRRVKLIERLNIAEKIYEKSNTFLDIARDYNIGITCVHKILKTKEVIQKYGIVDLTYRIGKKGAKSWTRHQGNIHAPINR